MRLDKFLKVSRIIKRRTVAKEACEKGLVQINGKTAKSSSEVKIGDELTLTFGEKRARTKRWRKRFIWGDIMSKTKKKNDKLLYKVIAVSIALMFAVSSVAFTISLFL